MSQELLTAGYDKNKNDPLTLYVSKMSKNIIPFKKKLYYIWDMFLKKMKTW
jgi:hypothetical protein